MTRAEQLILENQAAILSLLSEICQAQTLSRLALDRIGLIGEQIQAWRDDERAPSENPYFQAN